MVNKQGVGGRVWTGVLLFGLLGQLAWVVENMYFNLFLYNEISKNVEAISIMVGTSAAVATVTTLLMGALSDKLGKRKLFISVGYIAWGVVIFAFAFIKKDYLVAVFPASQVAAAGVALVIIMDCVMTFFGSASNDAAFNSWLTDTIQQKNRGKVEGITAVLPLVAVLIVFGAFDPLTKAGNWQAFFIIIGCLVSVGGVLGLFILKDKPLAKSNGSYFKDIFYGFMPRVVVANAKLYVTLIALGVFGIATQIFMPYLMIYMTEFLRFENYAIVIGLIILLASAVSVAAGRIADKIGRHKLLLPALALFALGALLMFFARSMVFVIVSGTVMMSGNLTLTALIYADLRDRTPKDKAGMFQGIRMIFAVLIPMIAGPAIGSAVIAGSDTRLNEYGQIEHIPNAFVFLATAVATILILVPILLMLKNIRTDKPSLAKLPSPYADELNRQSVLPEYPRPQMRRQSYICLNGEWDYAMVDRADAPTHGMPKVQGKILVPFSPESILSGVEKTLLPSMVLYYRRTFSIRAQEKKTLLHFGAVDQSCEVFVNGQLAGSHHGGYLAFCLDISELICDGENEIMVRVVDITDSGFETTGKQRLQRGGIFYSPISGIWQTVWLEQVPKVYIKGLKISPDFDGATVSIGADVEGEFEVEVFADEDCNGASIRCAKGQSALTVRMDGFTPWSPECPHLYGLRVRAGEDCVQSYFGMRKFSVELDGESLPRLFLNNAPYFHNGLLDQGYISDGIYTYPTEQAIVSELSTVKEMGFNMLRKHVKIECARWYYHCDRLGILVWQDMPNGGSRYSKKITILDGFLGKNRKDSDYKSFARDSEQSRSLFEQELAGMINQLYNAVSIAVWVPFNEGWGQFDASRIYSMVRQMDETRTIDHASGWHDQGTGDLKSAHIYFKPIRVKSDARPYAVTEFGGYGLKLEEHSFNLTHTFGYKNFASANKLEKAYQRLYEKEIIAQIPKGLSAAIYTQLSDVEDEINGLLTYDRQAQKIPTTTLQRINAKCRY